MSEPLTLPGRGWSVASFAAAGAALWVWPPLFGAVGLASALVAILRGDRLGRPALAVATACLVVGLLLHQLPDHVFA